MHFYIQIVFMRDFFTFLIRINFARDLIIFGRVIDIRRENGLFSENAME